MAIVFRRAAIVVLALIVAAAGWVAWHTRDRHRGYAVDLCLIPSAAVASGGPLRVGFGRERITPSLSRTVWLAGFATGRRATAIHDDLWAVAAVIHDGDHSVAIVALDAIGLFHDDVIEIRERVAASQAIDYVIVTSTHNHSAPDLMGLWGPRTGFNGVDQQYREQVLAAASRAIVSAAAALAPARLSLFELPLRPDGLVADSRDPQVFDSTIRVMHFAHAVEQGTLGSIVNWADHPETPWSDNTEITADFPGYLRDILEHGIEVDGHAVMRGMGGVHLYVNGAIGGLMTTNPETAVEDPFDGRTYREPSHEKARAVARRLGEAILTTAIAPPREPEASPTLTVIARTIELPVDNKLFTLALAVGTVNRGQPRVGRLRSEVALVRLGDATVATMPGELYPEIANGGIVRPAGADFPLDPVEVPPLRDLMPGRVKFVFGLANDAIGYIIPKSEWDDRAPWLYDATHRLYGEQVSLGPETAPLLHAAMRMLIQRSPAGF
ncbi:MAG: hypothetical protein AB7N65_03315 [Vicinamibacterales bacterium]